MTKIVYQERKAQGCCTSCGNPVEESRKGKILCVKCEQKASEGRRNNYSYYQRIRICPICKTVRLKEGEKRCYICREYFNSKELEKQTDDSRKSARVRKKTLYDSRKEQGLCPYCGAEREDKTKTACAKCLARKRRNRYRLQERRRSNSRCTKCGKPVAPWRYTFCDDCRRKAAEYDRQQRERCQNE